MFAPVARGFRCQTPLLHSTILLASACQTFRNSILEHDFYKQYCVVEHDVKIVA